MKDDFDPTSQSEDETKFYREVEDMIEKNGGTMPTTEFTAFHALWGKAVGAESYDKREWQKLEHALFYATQEDAVKTKRTAYAVARVERLRRELEEAKHNLRVEQGYSQ